MQQVFVTEKRAGIFCPNFNTCRAKMNSNRQLLATSRFVPIDFNRILLTYEQIQNRMLETSVTQQEEYYRKNLSDLTDQQTSEMKLMQERAQETEKRFLDYQKALNEEIATLKKDNAELKLGGGAKNATPSALEAQLLTLQQENAGLLNKVKEITAEKIAVVERLKVNSYIEQ